MLRIILLWTILTLISFKTIAQQKIIKGYILDSLTHFVITNAKVSNATAAKSVFTDAKGFFQLRASPNDFIFASAKSYHHDTLTYAYISTDTITIYLSPAGNILPAVTVTAKYNKYQLDSIERITSFLQDIGKPMKTLSTDHSSGFGLTFNLDKVFKKKYRYRKKDERSFETTEKMAYVNYRFSPQIAAYYTGFKGDTLRDFLSRYTPKYQWLRQHVTNEDVLFYINDNLKLYRKAINR